MKSSGRLQFHLCNTITQFSSRIKSRPHVARVCQDFLANHSINPLDWPPYSPDVSPIEHLWDEMDRRVRGRRNAPATLDQLRAALLEE